MGANEQDAAALRDKFDRELKSGLLSLVLLQVIDAAGPEYGYRILRIIEEASGGDLTFQEGTAYPILQKLERRGLVTTFWARGEGGPPRKYYEITALGREILRDSLESWRGLTASVERVIHGAGREATT